MGLPGFGVLLMSDLDVFGRPARPYVELDGLLVYSMTHEIVTDPVSVDHGPNPVIASGARHVLFHLAMEERPRLGPTSMISIPIVWARGWTMLANVVSIQPTASGMWEVTVVPESDPFPFLDSLDLV